MCAFLLLLVHMLYKPDHIMYVTIPSQEPVCWMLKWLLSIIFVAYCLVLNLGVGFLAWNILSYQSFSNWRLLLGDFYKFLTSTSFTVVLSHLICNPFFLEQSKTNKSWIKMFYWGYKPKNAIQEIKNKIKLNKNWSSSHLHNAWGIYLGYFLIKVYI